MGSLIFIQEDFAKQYRKITIKILKVKDPYNTSLHVLNDPDQHEFDHFQDGQKRDDDLVFIRVIGK